MAEPTNPSPREMAAEYRRRRTAPTPREMAAEYRRRNAPAIQQERSMDPYRGYAWNQPQAVQPPYRVGGVPNQTDNTATPWSAGRETQQMYQAAMAWAEANGMGDFVKKYYPMLLSGEMTLDQVKEAWRETPAYAQRFPAMAGLRQRGLEIGEGEYVQLERQYRQMLTQIGVGDEYFDREDIASMMLGDISPSEAAQRAQMAVTMVNSRDKELLRSFEQYYGIKKSDLVAYYLNPDKALPVLQRKAEAAAIGAEALRSGVEDLTGKKWSESLVDQGVDQMNARAAFGQVSQQQDTLAMLGNIDGTQVSTKDQAEAVLGLDNNAEQKVRGLKSRERARFGGSAGGTRALGAGDAAGSY